MTDAPADLRITPRAVVQALTRPYPVTLPMVALVLLVPVYLVIADRAQAGTPHAPALALDRLVPVVPAWALIYGALYAFLIVLPVLVVQDRDLIRRTVWAYLAVWGTSYVVFLLVPTVAPRPAAVPGDGFAAWGLRFLYEADPPYNCFPSIHVAHSFVSALAAWRVHRSLGVVALLCASLVALSTLFTRQHYVADLAGGILLALAAYWAFMRGHPRAEVSAFEHRVAPAVALCAAGLAALGFAFAWAVYLSGFRLTDA